MLRLQLDEHMSNDLLRELRKAGFDVVLPKEIGLRSADDDVALSHAAATGRVIVTDDVDFLRMHRRAQDHAGIVFCGPRLTTPGHIVRSLRKLSKHTTQDALGGRLIYLSNIFRTLTDDDE